MQAAADEDGTGLAAAVGQRQEGLHLQVLGLSIASLATTGLTGGRAATPAAGFGLFLMLLGGLSLAVIPMLRRRDAQ